MCISQRIFLLALFLTTTIYGFTQPADVKLAYEYYRQGEVEKARTIYDKLARNSKHIGYIHEVYVNLLVEMQDYKAAEKYLDRVIKWYPEVINYRIDKGWLLLRAGKETAARLQFNAVIDKVSHDGYQSRRAAQHFLRRQLPEYAIQTLLSARKRSGDAHMFAIDLANIYRMQNDKGRMVEEYLNFAVQNPRNLQYVKNTFQMLLTEPEDLDALSYILYDLIQQQPDNEVYGEMLIWVSMQQHNFYEAFVQARAIDKRQRLGGSRVLNVGVIALNNKDYENAIRIFDYLVDTYPDSNTGIQAHLYRIRAREELVKNSFPVAHDEVRKLIREYDNFIRDYGNNQATWQAALNKARLYAFYLQQNDSAIHILNKLIAIRQLPATLRAEAKLTLADIYLLDGQPWESALLYAQVDKEMKESALGYEAKLRNARLAYYRGDFKLAEEYLDILKLATSREIANDALQLSIFIKTNSALDSSDAALKKYAHIELLLRQNRVAEAEAAIDTVLQVYEGHLLTDDLLYLKADIRKKAGDFATAASLYQKIVDDYGSGLLGDKAYYQLGMLYEGQLKDHTKAMDVYSDFLHRYPGSIYATEVRKRYRVLRGDAHFVPDKEVN